MISKDNTTWNTVDEKDNKADKGDCIPSEIVQGLKPENRAGKGRRLNFAPNASQSQRYSTSHGARTKNPSFN